MNEELLIKFLTRTCTAKEMEQVEDWISEKANACWLFEMERVWSLKDELRFSEKKKIEQAYNRFTSNIEKRRKQYVPGRYFRISTILKYVAVLAIISLLSLNLYKFSTGTTDVMNIIEVPEGQRVSMVLSDGTKVWLNSQTRFTYPGQFSGKSRHVNLQGEAFFEVTRNEKVPFIVNADLIDVKVLGTKFNMRAYPLENSVVTLAEGKVEVKATAGEHKLILSPREQAVYSKETGLSLIKNVDPDIFGSWTNGEAAFVNKELDEICRDLERKFDVKIDIVDSVLAKDIFTCRFKESATIEQVLALLKDTRRLEYAVDGQQIRIFEPKKNKPMEKH